jgi:hypothetical protein
MTDFDFSDGLSVNCKFPSQKISLDRFNIFFYLILNETQIPADCRLDLFKKYIELNDFFLPSINKAPQDFNQKQTFELFKLHCQSGKKLSLNHQVLYDDMEMNILQAYFKMFNIDDRLKPNDVAQWIEELTDVELPKEIFLLNFNLEKNCSSLIKALHNKGVAVITNQK